MPVEGSKIWFLLQNIRQKKKTELESSNVGVESDNNDPFDVRVKH